MPVFLVQTLTIVRAFLRKRSSQLLLLVLFVVVVVFVIRTYQGAVQQNRTHAVAAEFGSALHELQNTPPGIARVEVFLSRLKSIDTSKAPAEVRQALQSYIAALEPSIDAARRGRSIAPYDAAIARAKQQLTDSVREND